MNLQSAVTTCQFSDQDTPHHNHTHLSCELIYVRKGSARFVIHDKTYTVGPNTLVFINTMEEHSVEILERPYERYFFSISSAVLEKQIRNPKLTSIFKNRPEGFNHVYPVGENARETEKILEEIIEEYGQPENFSGEMIGCLLEQLLILLYRQYPTSFPLPDRLVNNEILSIQRHIERHFTENISISQLAEDHFISSDYLSHVFKQLTGYSPKQYILLNRLVYARELVLQNEYPINIVAFKSGFNDVNNFIRSYKKQFGTTPKQNRKD